MTGEERVAEELRKEHVELQDEDWSSAGTSVADVGRRSSNSQAVITVTAVWGAALKQVWSPRAVGSPPDRQPG